ncbi:NAD-binding protein [Aurantimonas aggregata]|uniref:NAD-binding protein n=1 Tax=Aurantimonas aggregata TaxID=2047720 RepID=A0A6L9MNF8_9HYPH|nr:NAD(P)/FAD-dependent oxidoreductase [Aurantimonas aggregata]NDV89387.1 NAD-binding protein [Aurantimonas aggregata]
MTRIRDAVVIGGGLAGPALAQMLAGAGRDVTLVERESGPHDKVCGEFLSHEAVFYLRRLGLDPEDLGAVAIDAVGLAARRDMIVSPLPFPAFSLSRRRLDEALIQRAGNAGAEIIRGSSVNALAENGGLWTARLANGQELRGRDIFIATGKHDLRGWKRPPGSQNDLIGLKLHYRLNAEQTGEIARRVELVLFPGGYGGLEPIECGCANLCLLVRKDRFAEAGNSWEVLLSEIGRDCPHLARRLEDATAVQERPVAISSIPYGFVRQTAAKCWHLGDQSAVIPSFAGEGMSIALHSAHLAARCALAGGSANHFQQRLASDVGSQVRRATLLSRLLVHGWVQSVVVGGLSVLPSILAAVASNTRIPTTSMRREASI